jgi:hypothetical protein
MRALSFGVVILTLVTGLGCGGTSVNKTSHGTAGTGAEAGAPTAEGGAVSSPDGGTGGTGGVGASGAAGGSASGAGAGGGPTLPPDGEIPPAMALHKLDLLLMVDNSFNTLAKQALLSDAMGWLLGPSGPKLSADDIHIGVVTSSLGSHGANGTRDVCVQADDDDHAHLIGQLRPGLTTFKNSGFLAWGPGADPDIKTVLGELQPMLGALGEHGCGYEASLEAWFRFLIDPEPPATIVVPPGSSQAQAQGVDAVVLSQRAAFLRPDSVLAVVMLSDENDCSIQDEGYGWLISRAAPMFRSTSACKNPNDKCCQSCAEVAANAGCPTIATDSECVKGSTLASSEDDLNLRCFEEKRRFGFSLLYPIARYRDGLTRQTVIARSTQQAVLNPIFAGHKRHPSQVILTGIVGVPWQDLADQASLTGPGLTNLTAAQLTQLGRWPLMIGGPDASPPKLPADPFMIETPVDRSTAVSATKHPLVDAALVASTSTNPQANVINGHETVNIGNRDLQAACTFPLAQPVTCNQVAFDADKGCRCFMEDNAYNRATCQPPAGGPAGITQYYEQAYPGVRHLQLLQSLGDNAVTASACPKVTTPDAADYGYRPAMKALAARLEIAFKP